MITILDRYIIKNYVGTLLFMLILLVMIFLVIDIQGHYQDYADNGFTILDTLVEYYPYYIIWAINLFVSILIFISVIYFTSRMADNTEIVAITSSGVSFFRFSRPYVLVGVVIMGLFFFSNHFILPWANIKKNDFGYKTLSGRQKTEYNSNKQISSQISPTEYLFVNSYSRQTKRGSGFLYQKFDDQKRIIEQVRASSIYWSEIDTTYVLNSYYERKVVNGIEKLEDGQVLKKHFSFTPDELLPEAYVAETMNTPKLLKFINQERRKGSGNINSYLNELYQRTSAPVSILILTLLAVSLSSQKKRGGIGVNLAVGIGIAFIYIFSFQALKTLSTSGVLSAWVAIWMPNIIFGIITIYLYFKRAFA